MTQHLYFTGDEVRVSATDQIVGIVVQDTDGLWCARDTTGQNHGDTYLTQWDAAKQLQLATGIGVVTDDMNHTQRDATVSAIVEILTPLNHKERDAVLIELRDYRRHWFEHAEQSDRELSNKANPRDWRIDALKPAEAQLFKTILEERVPEPLSPSSPIRLTQLVQDLTRRASR